MEFQVEKIDDEFLRIATKVTNNTGRDIKWSELKDIWLLNDEGAKIGVLNDFKLNTVNDKFEVLYEFTVWKDCFIDEFYDYNIELIYEDVFIVKLTNER